MAFDLLHQDGVDLRSLSLSERKRDFNRLCRQSHTPYLKLVETCPDGLALFDHCNKFGFEGVVCYTSGPSRSAIIARLEMHIEQLTIHVDELKIHTCQDEVNSEKARIKSMSDELERLLKLKELYATRGLPMAVYTHH